MLLLIITYFMTRLHIKERSRRSRSKNNSRSIDNFKLWITDFNYGYKILKTHSETFDLEQILITDLVLFNQINILSCFK